MSPDHNEIPYLNNSAALDRGSVDAACAQMERATDAELRRDFVDSLRNLEASFWRIVIRKICKLRAWAKS